MVLGPAPKMRCMKSRFTWRKIERIASKIV
jgi:hypothetical protein